MKARPWPARSTCILSGLLLAGLFWYIRERWDLHVFIGSFYLVEEEIPFWLLFTLLSVPGALLLGRGAGPILSRGMERLVFIIEKRGSLFPAILFILSFIFILLVKFLVLSRVPVTDDENAYHFQAKILLKGRLYLDSPPLAEFFDNRFIINNGRWYSKYPLGHPLVLAIGHILGIDSILTPLLGALLIFIIYRLASLTSGRRGGAVAGLLGLTSPFLLFTSATDMVYITSALFTALFILFALRSLSSFTIRNLVPAFSFLGLLILTRPASALGVSLPFLAFSLFTVFRRRREEEVVRSIALALVPLLLFSGAFLCANYIQNGHPLRTGYGVYGFYMDRFFNIPFHYMVVNISFAALFMNFWLYGWPLSFLFIPRRERTPTHRMLAAMVVSYTLVYLPYSNPGIHITGPVYFFELMIPLTVLTAGGFAGMERGGRTFAGLAPAPLLLSLVFFNLACFTPIQAMTLKRVTSRTDTPYRMVSQEGLHEAVVFVRGDLNFFRGTWVFSHRNNSPELDDDILYVKDLGERNRELLPLFPGRKPYLFYYDNRGLPHLTPLKAAD